MAPAFTPEEASWIARANAVVEGRRHLSEEEFDVAVTAEADAVSLNILNRAHWLKDMGKTMQAKEKKKHEALAAEKVSRSELVMALMGFCTMETYNTLMVYTMALMKVLEDKGLMTKEEIRAQIANFAKANDEGEDAQAMLEKAEKEAASVAPANPEEATAAVKEAASLVDPPISIPGNDTVN